MLLKKTLKKHCYFGIQVSLPLIWAVAELFFAACPAVGVSLTSADRSNDSFSQSVLFRVHEGVNIVSDFLLKVGSDSARLAALVKEFPSTSCTMYGPSRLNNNLLRTRSSITMQQQRKTVPDHC